MQALRERGMRRKGKKEKKWGNEMKEERKEFIGLIIEGRSERMQEKKGMENKLNKKAQKQGRNAGKGKERDEDKREDRKE